MTISAGILLYKKQGATAWFFLVHPGGPFWAGKDEAAWSIPKGLVDPEEDPLVAAIREFKEETGISIKGDFISLTPRKQKSGKKILAWALEQDIDADNIESNLFEMEWPPKSGRRKTFPEVDKAGWFNEAAARKKIIKGQAAFIDELLTKLV